VFYDPLMMFAIFLVAVWLAAKFVAGGDGLLSIIAIAGLFAFILPATGYLVAQDIWGGLALLVVAVVAAQWAFKTTLAESAGVVAVAWLVGAFLTWGF